MIDFARLQEAYDCDGIYSLQLEIGDVCYQGCVYCYMNAVPEAKNTLTDEEIGAVLEDAERLGITAIEWLGGEPLLRSSVFEHMAKAFSLGLRNNIWTGGLPLKNKAIARSCAKYAAHGLISVHMSTVNPSVYKALHPERPESDIDIILGGIKNILDTGYPPSKLLNSVTCTGLQTADDMVQTIDFFESNFGILTSLNIYHTYLRPETPPGELEKFIPKKEAIKIVYQRYTRQQNRDNLPMNCVNKQYCSATAAVLCNGNVTPCATVREPDAPNIHGEDSFFTIFQKNRDHILFKKLKDKNNLPESCRQCSLNNECWGCRSRAYAAGFGLYGKDPRCFRS